MLDTPSRLSGAGDVQIFGAREYAMRVRLDPDKIASYGLTATDVVVALREQNVQVAAGVVEQPPVSGGSSRFQLTVNALGRLKDARQFEEVVIKEGAKGEVLRVRGVARVELTARDYSPSQLPR